MDHQGLCDVKLFLDESLKAIRSTEEKQWLIVSGNDACDLDSTACAIAYAYFKQKKLGSAYTVIPLCNITRSDMILRTEITHWLKLCGLSWENLIYVDDLFEPHSDFVPKLRTSNSVNLVLVDHHCPTGQLAETGWFVIEVIDHHHVDKHATAVLSMLETCKYKHIEPVGSCSSLVTYEILQDPVGGTFPSPLWKMLYGALLIDTVGISPEGERAGRLTELDFRMANRIEDLIGSILFAGCASKETLFSGLENAKYDVKGLSTWDLLRRDTKLATVPEFASHSIVCSTVSGVDFDSLIKLPDFLDSAKRICDTYSANILVCITIGYPVGGNHAPAPGERLERRKALVLYSTIPNDAVLEQLEEFLRLPEHELGLQPVPCALCSPHIRIPGTIHNPKVTRKIILPTLVRFMRKQPPAGSSPRDPDDGTEGSSHDQNTPNATARVNVGGRCTEFTASVARIRRWLVKLPFCERADLVRRCLLALREDGKLPIPDSWSTDRVLSPWKLQQITEQLAKMVPVEPELNADKEQQHLETTTSHTNEKPSVSVSKPPTDAPRCRRLTLPTSSVMHAFRGAGSSQSTAKRSLFGRTRRVSEESGVRLGNITGQSWWLETEYHPLFAGIPPSWLTKSSLPMVEDTSFRLHRRLSNLTSCRSTGHSSLSADGADSLQPTAAELDLLRASFGLVVDPQTDVLKSYASRMHSPHLPSSAMASEIPEGREMVFSCTNAPFARSLSAVDSTGFAPCSGSEDPTHESG